ncbi:hypothetical protein, partial [Fischerella muscicola]|uniref:hypothetical protein n=1 Tax=Fischerella muscicola TaxID=92938 RepID=UPI0005583252
WGGGELTGPRDRQGGASAVDGFPGIKHLALGIRGSGEVGNITGPWWGLGAMGRVWGVGE